MSRHLQRLGRVVALGFWLAIVVLAGCGSDSAESAASQPVVNAAEPQSGEMEASLDFFLPNPVPASTQPPAPPTVVDQGDPTTAPTDAAESQVLTATTVGTTPDVAAETTEPQLRVSPSSFVLAVERDVIVSGTGFGTDIEVLVVTCELAGEPVIPNTSLDQIGERIVALDLGAQCDFEHSTTGITDIDGSFDLSILVDIGPATVILAGPQGGTTSLFVPLYLDS